MRRKRLVLTLLFATVLALLLWWHLSSSEREPVYRGRTLSQWLCVYTWPGTIEERDAVTAVRTLGTNSLPLLVRWVAYQPPAWKQKLAQKADILPRRLRTPRVQRFQTMNASTDVWASKAAAAFRAMGEQAAPAVPELSKLLTTYDPRRTPWRAIEALQSIGDPGLPALAMVVTNRSFPLVERKNLAAMLRPIRQTNMAALVHILAASCADPDLGGDIIPILGELHCEPQVAVQPLVASLRSHNFVTRMDAARALGEFGKQAEAAVPDLVAATHDEVPAIRLLAKDSLRKIAPESVEEKWHQSEAPPTDARSAPDQISPR